MISVHVFTPVHGPVASGQNGVGRWELFWGCRRDPPLAHYAQNHVGHSHCTCRWISPWALCLPKES